MVGMKRWVGAAVALAVVAAVVVAGLLVGRKSPTVDRAAWGRDLAAIGVTVSDWDKLEKTTRDVCDDDQDALAMFVAVAKDSGTSMQTIETNVRNVCPDRVQDFEAAVTQMGQTAGEVDQACQTPAEQRTQRQQDLASAMGC